MPVSTTNNNADLSNDGVLHIVVNREGGNIIGPVILRHTPVPITTITPGGGGVSRLDELDDVTETPENQETNNLLVYNSDTDTYVLQPLSINAGEF